MMAKLVLVVVDLITVPLGFSQLGTISRTVASSGTVMLHHLSNISPLLGSPLASIVMTGGNGGAVLMKKVQVHASQMATVGGWPHPEQCLSPTP